MPRLGSRIRSTECYMYFYSKDPAILREAASKGCTDAIKFPPYPAIFDAELKPKLALIAMWQTLLGNSHYVDAYYRRWGYSPIMNGDPVGSGNVL